jgi:hypothetical protein
MIGIAALIVLIWSGLLWLVCGLCSVAKRADEAMENFNLDDNEDGGM